MADVDLAGRPWPPYLADMMNLPEVLRARARVRRAIAEQDRIWGDTWAEHSNLGEAQRLEGKAYAQGISSIEGLEGRLSSIRTAASLSQGRPRLDGGPVHTVPGRSASVDSHQPDNREDPSLQDERFPPAGDNGETRGPPDKEAKGSGE